MNVTVTSDLYEGSYNWTYDSSTGVITGELTGTFIDYDSINYNINLLKVA